MYTKYGVLLALVLLWGSFWDSPRAKAGVIGSFKHVKNLPGYIDLDRKSPWYQGVLKKPKNKTAIDQRMPSQIIADFFPNGHLDMGQVEGIISEAERLRRNGFIAFCMERLPAEAKDNRYCLGEVTDATILKKWAKKEANVVLQYVVIELRRAMTLGQEVTLDDINAPSSEPFLESFFTALDIFFTIKGEDFQLGRHTDTNRVILDDINYLFIKKDFTIEDNRPEAANLLIPPERQRQYPNQRFFSFADLKELSSKSYDISLLEPADSGMWRRPQTAVGRYDVRRYNKETIANLTHNMSEEAARSLLEPDETVDVVYNDEKYGAGDTAKLYGKIGKDKWKVKFLTDKVGGINTTDLMSVMEMALNAAEVNVENVVNNFAAALGFTVDPTYFKHKVRIFFPDEVYEKGTFDEAYEALIKNIEGNLIHHLYVRTAMQNVKIDEATGRRYIELRSVNLEKKSDRQSDINIGFFEREGYARSLQREHRAFMMFLAWVADVDPKNDNVRLKLIPNGVSEGNAQYKLAYSNSDMGAALGFGLPNYMSSHFISAVKKYRNGEPKSMTYEYRKIYPASILEAVSFNDAKWLGRRLAQLSPRQIYDAFAAAGFPDVVAQMYARKMISRRNQLLDALNLLGTTVVDDEGRRLIIERYEDEYNGVVPGYERYFKDGSLTDPNNEIFDPEKESFPRYWGTHWKKTKDKSSTMIWNHMGLRLLNEGALLVVNFLNPGAFFTGNGPTFSGMSLYRGGYLYEGCGNHCYFQGVGLGVGTFTPMRFIVDNPDREGPNPFLIIDMFRIGIDAGNNTRKISDVYGLGMPVLNGLRVGAEVFQIFEFMKIRAVKNLDDYVIGYKKSFKETPKLMFEKAKQQFIETMEPGDSMVLSSYLGTRGRLRFAPTQDPAILSPQVGVEGSATLAKRITLHKESDTTMLVNWAKLGYNQFGVSGGAKLGLNFDITNFRHLGTHQRERTFLFNMGNPVEKDYLMANLSASTPKDISEEYSMRERKSTLRQNRFDVGFFGLIGTNKIIRKIEVDLYDYLTGTKAKELSYERLRFHSQIKIFNYRTRSYAYKASVNEQFDPFIKVGLVLQFPEARERHFLRSMERIEPLVPDDFIVFDPLSVKEYLGNLVFKGSIIFSSAALAHMFAVEDRAICLSYVAVNPFPAGETPCGPGKYSKDRHLRAFMKDFQQAKESYLKLLSLRGGSIKIMEERRGQIYDHLKNFVEIFADYNQRFHIVKVLRHLLPKETFLAQGSLVSTLNGFPVGDDEIEISKPQRGTFEPSLRHIAEAPEEVYALFSDRLHVNIGPYFFNPNPTLFL